MLNLLKRIINFIIGLFKRSKPEPFKIISYEITPGKRHAWLTTNKGRFRKPLGTFTINE